MSKDNFKDVGIFHRKFGLGRTPIGEGKFLSPPRQISEGLFNFRVNFMEEELEEYYDAWVADDMPGMADALVDIVYVAMGTAHEHGFDWNNCWDEVQKANMRKMNAQTADDSKRGWHGDVVKPKGWTPPDIKGVLRRQGWKG